MDILNAGIIVITFLVILFPLKIYLSLRKYKEAAIGLIFTHLDKSIFLFKIYAVAVFIFAIAKLLDIYNIIGISEFVDNIATILYLTTNVLLIYSFYRLSVIVTIKEKSD